VQQVEFQVANNVGYIRLQRAQKRNALGPEAVDQFLEIIKAIVSGTEVAAIVISAEGSYFSAGGDLDAIAQLIESKAAYAKFLGDWHEMIFALERLPVPVVAAVEGDALAGGLEILLACDIIVMATEARLADAHASAGFYPAGGSLQRLPQLVGKRMATWLLLSGSHISSEDARALGLVNEVLPRQQVYARAEEIARLLTLNPRELNASIKREIATTLALGVEESTAQNRASAVHYMTSAKAREYVEIFRSRRRAKSPESGGANT
jgi:enoyl-CoA hydratase/carnithine racemase